ncbi:MAG: lipopolysaccharide heptosyltransferase II [bacterium]
MTTRRVLVRLPNWLGDVVMARPVLWALRQAWPQAELLGVGPAALCAPLVDEGLLHALAPAARDAAARRDAARAARAFRPEVAFVLPGSFSSAWLAWRSGASTRIGFRGEGRRPLLTHAPVRAARGDRHQSDEFLDLAALVGVREAPGLPVLAASDAGRAEAARLRAETGVTGDYAIMGPRSAYGPAREWFPDRFAATARGLAERGLRVLVCGTASEAAACDEVVRASGGAALALAGRTTLPGLLALAAGARLAVCNDSGLAHLAAAAGTPTIQIYGSAASGWTAARGPHVRILHRAPVCSPCWQRRCTIGTRCLDAIGVPLVLRAADALLAEAA